MKCGDADWLTGAVPGSVYSILLANGAMDDPFDRDNELDALELMDHDFVFRRSFLCDAQLLACEQILLRCEGLDTLCSLTLNGKRIGTADNFHRTWEFDVKDALVPGENRLEIEIKSPVRFIREKDAEYHVGGSVHAMRGFPHIRKPHCMFGWDWGPRIPDAGIWRSIDFIGVEGSRITDVHILQEHSGGGVELDVRVTQSGSADISIQLRSPGRGNRCA